MEMRKKRVDMIIKEVGIKNVKKKEAGMKKKEDMTEEEKKEEEEAWRKELEEELCGTDDNPRTDIWEGWPGL